MNESKLRNVIRKEIKKLDEVHPITAGFNSATLSPEDVQIAIRVLGALTSGMVAGTTAWIVAQKFIKRLESIMNQTAKKSDAGADVQMDTLSK